MTNNEMMGKYKRLKDELAAAYSRTSWDAAHIDRITHELAAVERRLASRSGASNLGLRKLMGEPARKTNPANQARGGF